MSAAVILAAGWSFKFFPPLYDRPKGLFTYKGEVLIERQIRQLVEAGCGEVWVVLGYEKERFFYLEDKFDEVRLVVNEHWASEGNTGSIACARGAFVNDGAWLCCADHWYEENPFLGAPGRPSRMVGPRVGAGISKQFVEVEGRPVLAYTIERFDAHPEVDAIEVVIRAGWEGYLSELVEREGFAKVRWTAPAGEDFQRSVINGIEGLVGRVADDDVILVHYGASPMVPDDVISDAIRVCALHGNASPAHSQVYLAAERQDGESTTGWLDRDEVMVLNSPQALRYGYARRLYAEAERRGLLAPGACDPHTTSLMFAMGERVWFSKGSTANIKITTPEDLRLFRGWVLAESLSFDSTFR